MASTEPLELEFDGFPPSAPYGLNGVFRSPHGLLEPVVFWLETARSCLNSISEILFNGVFGHDFHLKALILMILSGMTEIPRRGSSGG